MPTHTAVVGVDTEILDEGLNGTTLVGRLASVTRNDEAVHEAGHAILLLSCGLGDELELAGLDVTADDNSRGRNTLRMQTVREYVSDVALASTPAVSAALSLVAYGGIVAEKLFDYPGHGFGSDQRLLVVHLLDLIGADLETLETTVTVLDTTWKGWDGPTKAVQFNAFEKTLEEYAETLCGYSLSSAFKALQATAEDRLSRSMPAVARLRRELLITPKLPAAQVQRLIDDVGWCGIEGIPTIPGYYPSTSFRHQVADV